MAINLDFTGFRSILVDVDAMAQQHPALDAALALAARWHAKVKVVDVVWDVPDSARDFVTPNLEREIVENHREHLVRLACWRQRSVLVETALLRGAPGIALVQEVPIDLSPSTRPLLSHAAARLRSIVVDENID